MSVFLNGYEQIWCIIPICSQICHTSLWVSDINKYWRLILRVPYLDTFYRSYKSLKAEMFPRPCRVSYHQAFEGICHHCNAVLRNLLLLSYSLSMPTHFSTAEFCDFWPIQSIGYHLLNFVPFSQLVSLIFCGTSQNQCQPWSNWNWCEEHLWKPCPHGLHLLNEVGPLIPSMMHASS